MNNATSCLVNLEADLEIFPARLVPLGRLCLCLRGGCLGRGRLRWLRVRKDAFVVTPATCDGKDSHAQARKPDVTLVKLLFPLACERRAVEERPLYVHVLKEQLNERPGKVVRRECLADGREEVRRGDVCTFPG